MQTRVKQVDKTSDEIRLFINDETLLKEGALVYIKLDGANTVFKVLTSTYKISGEIDPVTGDYDVDMVFNLRLRPLDESEVIPQYK